MNASTEINKYIDIEGRTFCISKYPANDGIKTARLAIAKLLPAFEDFISPEKFAQLTSGETSEDEIWELLNVANITRALELVSDDDIDTIFNRALLNCYERLPAGNARVKNANGTYGVEGVEYDYVLAIRLVAESLIWSIGSFFVGDRLTSMVTDIRGSDTQSQDAAT